MKTLFNAAQVDALFGSVGDCYSVTYSISSASGSNTAFDSSTYQYAALGLASWSSGNDITYNTDIGSRQSIKRETFSFWVRVQTSDGRTAEQEVLVENF